MIVEAGASIETKCAAAGIDFERQKFVGNMIWRLRRSRPQNLA
jgi:hypothetical protein